MNERDSVIQAHLLGFNLLTADMAAGTIPENNLRSVDFLYGRRAALTRSTLHIQRADDVRVGVSPTLQTRFDTFGIFCSPISCRRIGFSSGSRISCHQCAAPFSAFGTCLLRHFQPALSTLSAFFFAVFSMARSLVLQQPFMMFHAKAAIRCRLLFGMCRAFDASPCVDCLTVCYTVAKRFFFVQLSMLDTSISFSLTVLFKLGLSSLAMLFPLNRALFRRHICAALLMIRPAVSRLGIRHDGNLYPGCCEMLLGPGGDSLRTFERARPLPSSIIIA
jgi:hypothetical protein